MNKFLRGTVQAITESFHLPDAALGTVDVPRFEQRAAAT